MIEAAFDVSFKYPLWRVLLCYCAEALFDRISGRSSRAKAVRVRVCRCFRYWVKGKQVESLHCSTLHNGHTQRTLPHHPHEFRDG